MINGRWGCKGEGNKLGRLCHWICFVFFFWNIYYLAVPGLSCDQGWNPGLQHWERGVLANWTTRELPPDKYWSLVNLSQLKMFPQMKMLCQCIFPLTFISFSNNPVCVPFQAFLYCIPMWAATNSTCWEQMESLTKTRSLYQWSVISEHICCSVQVRWVRYKEITNKKP